MVDESKIGEIPFQPSTMETIDTAMFEWLRNDADVHCTTPEGFRRIPTIWISAERAFQRKHDKDLMQTSGSLNLPIITMERTGIAKDPSKKGTAYANIMPTPDAKGGSITIARRVNQLKTSNFANADAKRKHGQDNFPVRPSNGKIVYQTITIPQPVYIEVSYKVTITAEYQQQINEMVTPFLTRPGNINYFPIKKDGHLYEVFPESGYSPTNSAANLGTEERRYQTAISFKVLAYLIGDDKNQETPKMVVRQNAVEVKIPRERVISGDPHLYIGKNGFYRE